MLPGRPGLNSGIEMECELELVLKELNLLNYKKKQVELNRKLIFFKISKQIAKNVTLWW